MKVGADAPCTSNVQAVTCEHARVVFFLWVCLSANKRCRVTQQDRGTI